MTYHNDVERATSFAQSLQAAHRTPASASVAPRPADGALGVRILLPWEIAQRQRPIPILLLQQRTDRHRAKAPVDVLLDLTEQVVQRTEALQMRTEMQRTALHQVDGIDGLDNVEDGEFVATDHQTEATIRPPLRSDQAGFHHSLQDLGQITGRNLGDAGNGIAGMTFAFMIGEEGDGPQRIFGRLTDHEEAPQLYPGRLPRRQQPSSDGPVTDSPTPRMPSRTGRGGAGLSAYLDILVRKVNHEARMPVPAPTAALTDHHCHLFGALAPDEAIPLLADGLHQVAWYEGEYRRIFDRNADLRPLVRRLLSSDAPADRQAWRKLYTFAGDGGFDAFQATANLQATFCAWHRAEHDPVLAAEQTERVIAICAARCRTQGTNRVDWRLHLPVRCRPALQRHLLGRLLTAAAAISDDDFDAGLIVDLPRSDPLSPLDLLEELRRDHADGQRLRGYDLAGDERQQNSEAVHRLIRALGNEAGQRLTVHAGEVLGQRSPLAVVHTILGWVEDGLRRIGHGLVLGCDWSHLAGRQHYVRTDVQRRLEGDLLALSDRLPEARRIIDPDRCRRRLNADAAVEPEHMQTIVYDRAELDRLAWLQDWTLERCRQLGVLIECCPTSNRLIAGLGPTDHPLPRFDAAGVTVGIGSDDPGILATDLPTEYRLAAQWRAAASVKELG